MKAYYVLVKRCKWCHNELTRSDIYYADGVCKHCFLPCELESFHAYKVTYNWFERIWNFIWGV